MSCIKNEVLGTAGCDCNGEANCMSAKGVEKTCMTHSGYTVCAPVIKDGYTTTTTKSACATAMTEGTPAYFELNKACIKGVLSDLPDCNGSVDADIDPKNSVITSPKATKQCDCGGDVLDDPTKKCYTDPKGNSQHIDVCDDYANTEVCLCGYDNKVALKNDYCDKGAIKKGCMNEDDKCMKTSTTKCTVKVECNCGGTAADPDVAPIGGTCNGYSYTAPTPTCDDTNCTPTVPSGPNCNANIACICGKDTISQGNVCTGYAGDYALKKCKFQSQVAESDCNCGDKPLKAE